MNGKKYKVTIRVVDHPPRYCDEWNKQQKMKEINQDHDKGKVIAPLTEVKPVLESHVSLGDPDNMSRLNGIDFTREVTPRDYIRRATKANDRPSDSHMKECSDFDRHTLVSQPHNENRRRREQKGKPLEPTKSTSLNIYKLKRSNVIEDHNNDCFGEDRVSLGADLGEVLETSNNRQPKSQGAGLSYLNNGSSAKVGFGTGKNGFHVGVPVVILSSAKDSQKAELNSLPMNATANSVQDGLSSDLFAADSFKRPLLNREGSVCSSDSIITEIEGLTDDENVDEPCGKVTQSEDDPNEQPAQKAVNNNWKKIRSMIHWSPFAKNYKKKYPWVQLAGHQGNFKAGDPGTILKKTNNVEKESLMKLMKDVLRPYVPEFRKEIEKHGEYYLVMQDLLSGFESPSVMDCKMGVRTFLEDELEMGRKKPKLREDLYQKMIDIDPNAPTEEERKTGAISKPRYMKWREELSSSATLGFRIEGIKMALEKPNKDFKTTRSREDVGQKFRAFINDDVNTKVKYLQRLKAIRGTLESSSFFRIHEVIGSSLLFVHDSRGNVNIWMIDFAKTRRVRDGIQLNHREKWKEGNHEDGYLFGLDNMISIWSDI